MKKPISRLLLAACVLFVAAGATMIYGQYPTYRTTDARTRSLLTRLETKTNSFQRSMSDELNRGRWNNATTGDMVRNYILDFENATDTLRLRIDSRKPVTNEVNDVLTKASYIDRFMAQNNVTSYSQTQWASIRTDLETLARYYNVSWNWNQTGPVYPLPGYPTGNYPRENYPSRGYPSRNLDARLTGTYRLNTSASDNVADVIDRSINAYPMGTERDNSRRSLERRLNSPDMIAIEKHGQTVTLASTLLPQVTIQADGVARTETNARGRTTRTIATTDYNGVEINYQGDRGNEFNVNFEAAGNDRLRVSRRIFLGDRNQTVTVNSVYDKIDPVAQWSTVNNGAYPGNYNAGTNVNDFYVPNGTRIEAVLRTNVTTRASQVGDRFTMDVISPPQYQGAVIEGRVADVQRSGRVSGRANLSLDFDTIRFTDGRTYRFAGLIDSVRTVNGDTVSINNEGAIRDRNQTTTTATRAGIGAAVGALIGAIAGGGEGAAIGAAVGAGAGAGSVLIQGRDNMDLGGSTVTITASSPNNVGVIR